MAVLRQMQHSQDEKFRILAEENMDLKGKFTALSDQFTYESNYMASGNAPAAPESQPIALFKDLVPSDPTKFDGTSKNVATFCNQVRNMLRLAPTRFSNPVQTVHYVATLLTGPAFEWYSNYLDANGDLPNGFGAAQLLQELQDCFGEGDTRLTKERHLRELRQTGLVSNFTVQFRAIVKTFPLWPDHPTIYTFFEKLKPELRREILKVQDPLETFSAYVTFVKKVDRPSKPAYIPPHARVADQFPQQVPPHLQIVPMDLDGTRRQILKVEPAEMARRVAGNLCHYCGLPGHDTRTCPNKGKGRTVRFLDLQHS